MNMYYLQFPCKLILGCVTVFGLGGLACEKALFPISEYAMLPKMTASGQNSFGCLVDAKATIYKSQFFGPNELKVNYIEDPINGNFLFTINCKTADGAYFRLKVPEQLIEGKTYPLSNLFDVQGQALDLPILSNYYIKSPLKGALKVTYYNVSQRIVCGTFWFDAQTIDSSIQVKVTDGRFDVRISIP